MRRVLVTARNAMAVQQQFAQQLAAEHLELVPAPRLGDVKSEAELLDLIPGCFAVVAMPDAYTARVIEAGAPTLRLIARFGVGYDSIDLAAATRNGVWATTTPGANHDAVADYAILQLLALARDFVSNVSRTRSGVWQRVTGIEFRDKTMAVIGTGRVGREVAARARGFGVRLIAHDVIEDRDWAAQAGVTYLSLREALAAADFITLHTPLLPETHHLLNTERLAWCKPGVLIVNTARGPLIDERALVNALDSGQVGGAALDVFDREPPVDRTAVDHPKVLPTAHSAGGTHDSARRSGVMAIEEVLRVARGGRPRYPVNALA